VGKNTEKKMIQHQLEKIIEFTLDGSNDKTYSMEKKNCVVDGPQISNILKQANVKIPFEVEKIIRENNLEIENGDRERL
jgi:hypothetical protein